jgi:hypothetical protein
MIGPNSSGRTAASIMIAQPVIEHVRRTLRQMLAILIAALAHDIPEQHAALRGIDHVFQGRGKYAERLREGVQGRRRLSRGWHGICSVHHIP